MILVTLCSMVVNLVGCMVLAGIQLNAGVLGGEGCDSPEWWAWAWMGRRQGTHGPSPSHPPVSLVNLVASLGIGVEFCVHILHAFMEESGSRDARVGAALTDVGGAVLSGITLTKVVGVAVLGLCRTTISPPLLLFKMYTALVVVGADTACCCSQSC